MKVVTRSLFGAAVLVGVPLVLMASHTPPPSMVVIPGSLDSEIGCSGDWQPDCTGAQLTYDAADDVWQGTFTIPAGSFEYKAALNGAWTENYGQDATRDGPNITLGQSASGAVKFYYDHKTHWIADNKNKVIATVPGSYQAAAGCGGDWQPDCLKTWLEDPDGDNVYTLLTPPLAAGTYEAKVAINETWDVSYGTNPDGTGCGVLGGSNHRFIIPAGAAQPVYYVYNPTTHCLTINVGGAPGGDLRKAKAHWLSRQYIAWPGLTMPTGGAAKLYYSPTAGLAVGASGITGGSSIDLTYEVGGLLPADLQAKFPHLKTAAALRVPDSASTLVRDILKGQVAVGITNASGKAVDGTSAQLAGVLDDLYASAAANQQLGVTWSAGVPTIRVWAPTAQAATLHLFANADPATTSTTHPMMEDPATGIWTVTGDASWKNQFYLFEVQVFTRATQDIEQNRVTDPYSISLSTNSKRSQIVDLDDAALKPAGWEGLAKPTLDAPEDIVLYELHIRDFSASDQTVREPYRGTYMAFTEADSNGMKHLRRLANAGLTHIHLLPAFDIASVDEDKATWQFPSGITGQPSDSTNQQAAVGAVRDRDPFNWGYDPFHYTTPEGSYSTDPNGTRRIVEFREMVKGLAGAGLRTVMDVVYNHTNASGQAEKSVLDKVVPGYYHRYNLEGNVERSTCCENTATENAMMEKLMVDSVVTWAKYYKVDGFRFDIMGHHSKANMEKVRDALRRLTMASDGVDGSKIYLYGEGWNFGEVQNDARFPQARQINMAGTGIGTFNDRIRDATRGGGPFSGIQEQGFSTGLFVMPNGISSGGTNAQKTRLLLHEDQIRVSMAGNLKDYSFQSSKGATIAGAQLDYGDQPAGYTEDPSEVINYVSAHDNETIFDAIQMKAPAGADLQTRVRMNTLALAVVALGQGIPFFHAGDEILRSKSLDRNSFNSGDWFNRLDWTYATNNWGVGLPPEQDNGTNWALMKPLLANAKLKPSKAEITFALDRFVELLQIRKSSPLFRLQTAAEFQKRVKFYNTGVTQVPGLLVMALEGDPGATENRRILAIFNASPEQKVWQLEEFIRAPFELHPVQRDSSDPALKDAKFVPSTGGFVVPAWTAAVFVQNGEPTDETDTTSCGGCSVGPDAGLGALALAGVLWLRRRRTRARA